MPVAEASSARSARADAAGPDVDGDGVTFHLADPYASLTRVLLKQELGLPEPNDFVRAGHQWTYRLQRPILDGAPAIDRMEYLFEVRDRNDHYATVNDPRNDLRAGGAFGDKSVIEFPDYVRPDWLDDEPVPARTQAAAIDAPGLDGEIEIVLWEPEQLHNDTPAPLVVVHDGPEFDAIGRFTRYVGVQIARGVIEPVRVALVAPGERNDWYSANPRYAQALVGDVLREASVVAPATARIGVGASLGALAMLHAHISDPGTFDALLLLSGSFFTADLDPQESRFPRFGQITDFVGSVADDAGTPVPVVVASGVLEENHANNLAMANTLRDNGYPVTTADFRDMHNYTAWRDALHPHLAQLINTVAANGAHS